MKVLKNDHYFKGRKYEKGTPINSCPQGMKLIVEDMNLGVDVKSKEEPTPKSKSKPKAKGDKK